MEDFNLKKYLAENKLLDEQKKEFTSTGFAAVDSILKDVDDKLKQIDSKGTFEADDEVGTFFQTLKILMGQITEYWEK